MYIYTHIYIYIGDTLTRAVVRLFKERVPKPAALNVKLFTSDSPVSWTQVFFFCGQTFPYFF